MTSFPDVSARQSAYPVDFQDAGVSGSTQRRGINSYERMDAGLTIKTREGDIVNLSFSRFSELNAQEYSSRGEVTSREGQVSARTHQRQIQLSTGEAFSFSVQGDLNEQELADIENIVSGIDKIIHEMAQGDMDDAVALALSMDRYDSVSMYEADISVARSYASYTETWAATRAPSLPASGGQSRPVPSGGPSPFTDQVSRLLEAQEAEALAHARQPLSRLFDHYLEQQGILDAAARSQEDPAGKSTAKSPAALALETTARTVDQLIQEMVKEAFDKTLDDLV